MLLIPYVSWHVYLKQLTNFISQHFANAHQLSCLRQNTFCNQSLQYIVVLHSSFDLKGLIAKQFFSERWKSKCCKVKFMNSLKNMLGCYLALNADLEIVFLVLPVKMTGTNKFILVTKKIFSITISYHLS